MTVLWLLLLGMGYWLYLASRFAAQLQEDHGEVYARVVESGSPLFRLAFYRFLLRAEYEALDDESITGQGRLLRVFLVIYAVAFALWAALGPRTS
ncbi:MAG: hypothetical protein QNK03_12315 [Myxococcota bacterium]|nr:hypothetical protein [Myxococcota bacterium]